MPKICEFETCRKFANYGEFYGKPLRCKDHKEEFKLVSQLCHEGNCKFSPNYNYESEKTAIYCSEHKKIDMIDIKHKKCCYADCKKQSTYNYENKITPIYCFSHKTDGMINIKTNTCIEINCKIIPVFNFELEKTAIYCLEHKKEGMINIKAKKCIESKCNNQPNFNYKNEKQGIYCSLHKKKDMINVNIITCLEENCCKVPSCNFPGYKKRIYCSEHKKDGMINLTNIKCNYTNCLTTAIYNYENEKIPIYCSVHKKTNMIDIRHQICKSGSCLGSRGNPKYKGYCAPCYQHLFPNDPLTLQMRSKTKEIAVRDFINLNFEGFQHDKPLWTGNCDCTHRRKIDHRKLIGNTLLCVETDEDQHKGYAKDHEEIRYNDLYMLHSGKFIFIRFNPDKFKDKNNKSINPMLYTRLPVLKDEIEKQIKRIENEENKELLEIIKLYYDEIKN